MDWSRTGAPSLQTKAAATFWVVTAFHPEEDPCCFRSILGDPIPLSYPCTTSSAEMTKTR